MPEDALENMAPCPRNLPNERGEPSDQVNQQRVITYVLPDEPDTLYLLPATAQELVPDEATRGMDFEHAADLCRAVGGSPDVIRALVVCGQRFEQVEQASPNQRH
jgi:hypothetical protein